MAKIDKTCDLVTCETGNYETGTRYALLNESGRIFFSFPDEDNPRGNWKEAGSSTTWQSLSRHMIYVKTYDKGVAIPKDLLGIL